MSSNITILDQDYKQWIQDSSYTQIVPHAGAQIEKGLVQQPVGQIPSDIFSKCIIEMHLLRYNTCLKVDGVHL